MKFKITYGLGGGFNDIRDEVIEAPNIDKANVVAYDMAVEVFQEYEGLHGLRTIQDIMDEEDVDEDEAEEIYREEMESWLDYGAEPVIEDKLKKVAKEIKKPEARKSDK